MRTYFGDDWRGLEAPRHLSIPSLRQLKLNLSDIGFSTRQVLQRPIATAIESARIQRRSTRVTRHDLSVERMLSNRIVFSSGDDYDFLELVCVKGADHVATPPAARLSSTDYVKV